MNYPISEICDRLSIAMLKVERIGGGACLEEKEALLKELNKEGFDYSIYINLLKEVNAKIWDLESDVRKGKEGELGMEEVGRRAIAIREINKQRVSIKNEIVEKTNTGFKDIKMNHASE